MGVKRWLIYGRHSEVARPVRGVLKRQGASNEPGRVDGASGGAGTWQ